MGKYTSEDQVVVVIGTQMVERDGDITLPDPQLLTGGPGQLGHLLLYRQ